MGGVGQAAVPPPSPGHAQPWPAPALPVPHRRRRLVGVSTHCDYPPNISEGRTVVTRSLVEVDGKSSEEIEAQIQAIAAASGDGPPEYYRLDAGWLAERLPGVLLTQDSCTRCDATQSSVARYGAPPPLCFFRFLVKKTVNLQPPSATAGPLLGNRRRVPSTHLRLLQPAVTLQRRWTSRAVQLCA